MSEILGTTRIYQKNVTSIPKEAIKILKLKEGDKIAFSLYHGLVVVSGIKPDFNYAKDNGHKKAQTETLQQQPEV